MDDDAAAELERDLILARRLKLAVRVVIYPLLIGGVLIAWHVRHVQAKANAAPKGPPVTERQFTGDHAYAMTQNDQLTWLQADALEPCDDGSTFTFRLRFDPPRITQRTNLAVATLPPFTGTDDSGSSVDYGKTVASVTVNVDQLDVSIGGSLRWTRSPGHVVTCTAGPTLVTLSRIGA
jgi:hypothetical protein